jgi:hypothetical protein
LGADIAGGRRKQNQNNSSLHESVSHVVAPSSIFQDARFLPPGDRIFQAPSMFYDTGRDERVQRVMPAKKRLV